MITDSVAVKENVSVVVRDSRTGTVLSNGGDIPATTPPTPALPTSSASSASSAPQSDVDPFELGSPSARSPNAVSVESPLPASAPLVIRSITAFFIRAEDGSERLLSVPTKMGLRLLTACTPEELVVMRSMAQDIADEAAIEVVEREFHCSTAYNTIDKTPNGWPTNTNTYSPRRVKPATMKVGKIGGGAGKVGGGGGGGSGRIIL